MEMTELLKILACPACKGELELINEENASGFACHACNVVYPIRDGIPIMLIDEAISRNDWENGKR